MQGRVACLICPDTNQTAHCIDDEESFLLLLAKSETTREKCKDARKGHSPNLSRHKVKQLIALTTKASFPLLLAKSETT